MAFGKILADEFENSNGDNFDLVQATTSEATTSAKGYMSSSDKTKLDGIAPSSIAGVDTTVSASTATSSSSTSYTHTGSFNSVSANGTSFTYTNDDNATINTWYDALVVAGTGVTVSYTASDTSGSFVVTSISQGGGLPPGFMSIVLGGSGTGSSSGTLTSMSFGGTTYTVTLTGTETPVLDSTKAVTVGGTAYAAGDWTVNGTSATKSFDTDPSLSGTVAVYQQPVQSYEFESVSYALANASDIPSTATASVDGLLLAADKSKIDDRLFLDTGGQVPGFISIDSDSLAQYKLIGTTNTYYGAGTIARTANVMIGEDLVTTQTIDTGTTRFNHNVIIGRENTGFATSATQGNGFNTVAIGQFCLGNYGGFSSAVAIGNMALEGRDGSNTDLAGISNSVGIGYSAGRYSTGDSNTFIGPVTGATTTNTADKVTCIGYGAGTSFSPSGQITTDNIICLGSNTVTDIYCADTSISSSDARDKADVEDFTAGLSFIEALRPVTYRWDKRSSYISEDPESGESIMDVIPDGTHKKDRLNLGFLAQELEQVEKDHGYAHDKNDRLISSLNEEGTAMGVKYERLVPVLVNAIKELKAEIDDLKSQLS